MNIQDGKQLLGSEVNNLIKSGKLTVAQMTAKHGTMTPDEVVSEVIKIENKMQQESINPVVTNAFIFKAISEFYGI